MNIEVMKAALSCLSGLIVVAAGWLVGQRLSYSWAIRQKRQELQLANVQQFYAAYGEFFVVWKLWNRLDVTAAGADEKRWELQKRAASAEATVEALLVKLSSEADLSDEQIRTLGRFRQAFQLLRESIRKGKLLEWNNSDAPQYVAFKSLAVEIAQILANDCSAIKLEKQKAIQQMLAITNHRWELVWDRDITNYDR